MRYIYLNTILWTVLLTYSLHSIAAIDNTYNRIPFEKSSGLLLVNAVINGLEGKLVFDTGADHILINNSETKYDTKAEASFLSLTGDKASSEITLESFVMGAFKAKYLTAYAADLSLIEKHLGLKILGIFGAGLLDSELIEIDIEEGVIEIYSRKNIDTRSFKSLDKFPVCFKNGIPLIELNMNGESFKFLLDTGSSVSIVDSAILEKHPGNFMQTDKKFDLLTAASESSDRYYYNSYGMSLASMPFANLRMAVMDLSSVNNQLEIPVSGILSLDDLPFDSIIIDYKKGWIYIKQFETVAQM